MKSRTRGSDNVVKTLVLSVIILGAKGGYLPAWAQEQEIVLFEENFDDGQVKDWELEAGWVVAEGMLKGQGHYWARPSVRPWQDFRLQFRLRLQQGGIHLVYRLNDTGRYFIGFHGDGSYLKKQYWPETFIDLLDHSIALRDLGSWHDIEIGFDWLCFSRVH